MSSQGLGINFPQPNPTASGSSPRRPVGGVQYNTGRPSPNRSNVALPTPHITPPPRGHSRGAPLYQPGQPLYQGPQQAGQPLYQPQFSLRPTHARTPVAKGFTSFSAIPPSPGLLDVAKRTPATDSTHSHVRTISDVSGDVPWGAQSEEQLVRKASGSTQGTGNGTRSTRGLRRKVSGELLRKFSKSEGTISGGPYQALSGDEPDEDREDRPKTPTNQTMHTRSETISTTAATPARSVQQSIGPTPDAEGSGFNPVYFPQPHSQLPYRRPSAAPLAHGMPRSFSTPQHLSNIPEVASLYSRVPSRNGDQKRVSDPVTGLHSRNSALFAAEAGGVMLSYDGQSGMWEEAGDVSQLNNAAEQVVGGLRPRKSLEPEAALKARPWSDSTMEHSARSFHHRSLSDGAMLARQGTLLHPDSSANRKSQELGVLLGGRRRTASQSKLLPPENLQGWQQAGGKLAEQVRIEAAKKRRARVEVDVVLERECVVEGGEIRGRMDIRVNGGKRGEGVRVGGGKVRVIGFEDITAESRHIFYHVPHNLPVFAHPPLENGPTSSLFASYPDDEGYRLVNEGVHSIPFSLRLPLNGGAKGSYLPTRGPSVRYVVVGSIKLLMTATGKRSIAHFYRSVVVLPYLNPGVVLAPSDEPVEAKIEKGLGWTIGGDKGKVELRIAMGRTNWVAGQRVWFEVGIRNSSNRKIKTLNMALLQTVQTFDVEKQPYQVLRSDNTDEPGCTRRKVSEEIVEADAAENGAGRVTGREWWTGVEPGDRGHWDMSLGVPVGLITIPRSKFIEVTYTLRVTANSSVYVDIPVTLINFLSVDPPPMPGDGARIRSRLPKTLSNPSPARGVDGTPPLTVVIGRDGYAASEKSSGTLSLQNHAARASSTTLHIDALLAAGRERAQAEAMAHLPPASEMPHIQSRQRPLSMGSEYTPEATPHASVKKRPKPGRVMSYLSMRSGTDEEEDDIDPDDEYDKMRLQAARREGRKMSLAAIERAMDRQREEYHGTGNTPKTAEIDAHTLDKATPPAGAYLPLETPMEESYRLVGETPAVDRPMRSPFAPSEMGIPTLHPTIEETSPPRADTLHLEKPIRGYTPLPPPAEDGSKTPSARGTLVIANPDEVEDTSPRTSPRKSKRASSFDIDPYASIEHREEEQQHAGDETILEDLMPPATEASQGDKGSYDYGEDVEATPSTNLSRPGHASLGALPEPVLPFAADSSFGRQSRNGSFAASFTSEQESLEVGEVQSAIKRNLSIRLPPAVVKMEDAGMPRSASAPFLAPHGPGRKASHTSSGESDSPRGSPRRRGSQPGNGIYGSFGPPRGSTSSSVPSPLRTVEEVPSPRIPDEAPTPEPKAKEEKRWPGRPGFSFAASAQPLQREESLSPRKTDFNQSAALSPGPSPRTAQYPVVGNASSVSRDLNPKLPGGLSAPTSMSRLASGSQLRHQVQMDSSSEGGDQSPGLAPSAASDSESSDGHNLESPTATALASTSAVDVARMPTSGIHATSGFETKALPALPTYAGKEDPMRAVADLLKTMEGNPAIFDDHGSPPQDPKDPSWQPGDHLRQITVNRAEFADPPSPEASTVSHGYHDSAASPSIASSAHSIVLPSVAAKLAQLETRNEALRKFSVASAASGAHQSGEGSMGFSARKGPSRPSVASLNQPRPSVASLNQPRPSVASLNQPRPSVASLNQPPRPSIASSHPHPSLVSLSHTDGPRPSVASLSYNSPGLTAPQKVLRKRTSYTTALAPRPQRSHSDDIVDGSYHSSESNPDFDEGPSSAPPLENVGGTTWLSKKSYANSPPWEQTEGGVYDPFKISASLPQKALSAEAVTVSRQTSLGDGSGRWKMTKSTSSGSLTGLVNAPAAGTPERATPSGGRPMGPRTAPGRNTPGGYGHSGGYMSPTSPTPTRSTGRYGAGLMPPVPETPTRRGGYTNSVPFPGRTRGSFGAETDDSEGML